MFFIETVAPWLSYLSGRSAIAEAGGVELLYTMYCDAVGLPLPTDREQRYRGVKWMHLRKDLQSSLHYWKRGELTVGQWWKSRRGKKAYAMWSWHDPLPFFSDLRHALRSYLSPRERKRRADHNVQKTSPDAQQPVATQ